MLRRFSRGPIGVPFSTGAAGIGSLSRNFSRAAAALIIFTDAVRAFAGNSWETARGGNRGNEKTDKREGGEWGRREKIEERLECRRVRHERPGYALRNAAFAFRNESSSRGRASVFDGATAVLL